MRISGECRHKPNQGSFQGSHSNRRLSKGQGPHVLHPCGRSSNKTKRSLPICLTWRNPCTLQNLEVWNSDNKALSSLLQVWPYNQHCPNQRFCWNTCHGCHVTSTAWDRVTLLTLVSFPQHARQSLEATVSVAPQGLRWSKLRTFLDHTRSPGAFPSCSRMDFTDIPPRNRPKKQLQSFKEQSKSNHSTPQETDSTSVFEPITAENIPELGDWCK